MQDKQYIIEIRYNNDFACQIANWIIKSLHDSNIIVATLANRKVKHFPIVLDSFCQTQNAIKLVLL